MCRNLSRNIAEHKILSQRTLSLTRHATFLFQRGDCPIQLLGFYTLHIYQLEYLDMFESNFSKFKSKTYRILHLPFLLVSQPKLNKIPQCLLIKIFSYFPVFLMLFISNLFLVFIPDQNLFWDTYFCPVYYQLIHVLLRFHKNRLYVEIKYENENIK